MSIGIFLPFLFNTEHLAYRLTGRNSNATLSYRNPYAEIVGESTQGIETVR